MTASAFKSVVQNILNRWTGLKLCVEHESGGRHSKEKALYLVDYINEVLFTNSVVEQEDLEDLITDYMDSELQTILEDHSVRDVAKAILLFLDLFQCGKHEQLQAELNKLPQCDIWLDVSYQIPVRERRSGKSDDSETSDESEAEGGKNADENEAMDCDEWTQVTYRRNR